ncbi:hypothetical protein L596_007468 [Steinernema carpocapsae]|uniref:WD and tetratricopeptide repeats protein 1 n=1 Tax=Steinernema carpocapsae TaxID=34508 RepID=A0A4U5P9D2_STECR|nr:hypothetical protein L596_007468 [Steinernema carpocapsae]
MDDQLFQRSITSEFSTRFINENIVTESLVKRLGNSTTLQGHNGCVNCLDWNAGGTLLASGSDDLIARIWDCSGTCLHEIRTGHTQNIFSSMFLPAGDNRILLTAAGDNSVRMHNYTHCDDEPYVWTCQGRVKRLCVAFNDPQMFWSASEDGFIREYDVRTNSGKPLLIFKGGQCKTMAVDQSNPNIIAVGTMDDFIPIYDRRMAKVQEPVMRLIPAHLTFPKPRSKAIDFRSHYATHLAFNRNGDEIIANIGSEQVYIFNVKNNGAQIDVLRDLNSFLASPTMLEAPVTNSDPRVTEKFKALREEAKQAFGNHNFTSAIDLYSQAIRQCEQLCGITPSPSHKHAMDLVLLLANRGAGFMMRGWRGDAYDCVRDTLRCLQIDPSHKKAHFRLARSLVALKQSQLASRCSQLFKSRYPEERCIDKLDSMLSELEGEVAQRRSSENEWNPSTSGEQPYRDFTTRLVGHRNQQTDIKEANWWGGRDQLVVAGSDCGSLLIWERATGRVIRMFEADSHIVNVVQPHPERCLLATSGIDNVIRFWEPLPEDEKKNEQIRDEKKYADQNNRKMERDIMGAFFAALSHTHMQHDERRDDDGSNGGGDSGESGQRVHCATS